MTVRSDITPAMAWLRYETKTLSITVTDAVGDPVDLSTISLRWRLLREQGSSTVLMERTSISVSGADNNVAEVDIAFGDYDDVRPGIYAHELRDVTDHLVLTVGDAWLLPASAPSVAEV